MITRYPHETQAPARRCGAAGRDRKPGAEAGVCTHTELCKLACLRR
eukprot:SAG31_NODE_24397_length_482_cov_0.947781_1_plen_45_part_10